MAFLGSIWASLRIESKAFVHFWEGETTSVILTMTFSRTRVFSFLGWLFRTIV